MPRLANTHYLHIHRWLTELWDNDPVVFARVSFSDQGYLHDFFAPHASLSDEKLLAYRAKISKARPSLPAAAGKAAARLQKQLQAVKVPTQQHTPRPKREHRRVVVSAVRRPEIDVAAMSRALILAAEQLPWPPETGHKQAGDTDQEAS
jgi:uncharacterized membrane protein